MTAEDRTYGLGGAKDVTLDPLASALDVTLDPLASPEVRSYGLGGAASATFDPLASAQTATVGDNYVAPSGTVNVIEFLLDDVGIESLQLYDAYNDWTSYAYPVTPNIEAVAATGVAFTNCWAHSVCSPDRAATLTGTLNVIASGYTGTGIGFAVNLGDPDPLVVEDVPLAIAHAAEGTSYQHFHVGKWHLGDGQDAPNDPVTVGGNTEYRGCLTNMNKNQSNLIDSYIGDYTDYTYTVATAAGSTQTPHFATHACAQEVADALDLIPSDDQQPFIMRVWFHAPHSPWDDPFPDSVLDAGASMRGAAQEPAATTNPYNNHNVVWRRWKAGIEACDKAIGDILAGLSTAQRSNTVVIIRADNGSDGVAMTPVGSPVEPPAGVYDPDHMKQTQFEDGLRVPLIIGAHPATTSPAWIGTPGSFSDALCQTHDVWGTMADFTLSAWSSYITDGYSLRSALLGSAGPRNYSVNFYFQPNGCEWLDCTSAGAAARDARYKLIRNQLDALTLYDLQADPREAVNLYPPGTLALQQKAAELNSVLDQYLLAAREASPIP